MLRFRCFLPLVAPVLAVIGWWWYSSRKKKETATPVEEEESPAVRDVLNGRVESSRAGPKGRGEGNATGLVEENPVLAATAAMLGQSLAKEMPGRGHTSSEAQHSGLVTDPHTDGLESLRQGVSEQRGTPHLPKTGADEAEEAETRKSERRSLRDEQVAEAFKSGTGEEPAAEQDVAAEEDGTLAPPPPRYPDTAVGSVTDQITEAAEDESVAVPVPERLHVPEDPAFTGTKPHPLSPEVVVASGHVPTALSPPSSMEAEPPPKLDSPGLPLQTGPVLDLTEKESSGPVPTLNSEHISVATQEELTVRLYDVSEEGNVRTPQPSNRFPLSSEPGCAVVDQIEQDNSQTSMEVFCRLEEGRVDDITQQTSDEVQPLLQDVSLSTSIEVGRDEEVLRACIAPPLQDSCSGTEIVQENLGPEESPSSPGEHHTNDVTGTEDSGCSTGQSEDPWVCQCESPGEEVDEKPSDQRAGCVLAPRTETPCTALDRAEQEGDLTPNRVQQEGPLSAVGHEESQNGHLSPPVQEEEAAQDVSNHNRTAGLQKALGPEDTSLRRDKLQKDDVTGTEDSESDVCQSGDGARSQVDIPFTVSERPQNPMSISDVLQGSNGQICSPERKSNSSLEEGHQGGDLCRGSRITDPDLQNGSHMAHKTEGDHSGEISSVARLCESTEERKPSEQSSSCASTLTPETLCTAPDQSQQGDGQVCDTIQHLLQEGPFSVVPPEASGNDVSRNSPALGEPDDDMGSAAETVQKNPETTPMSPDELQKSPHVARAEDSGCSSSQRGDGVGCQAPVCSSGPPCPEPEQEEERIPISVSSLGLEEQVQCPGRESETSSEESHQGTFPRGEGLTNTDPQGEGLTNTDPQGESLTNTDPRGESLTNTDPQGESLTNTDPQGESLTNTDPQGESLINTDPQGESLTNTDRRGESLTNTDPRGEGLTNTDRRGESLTNTDRRGESLTNTDPRGESLTNTDRRGESLTNTDRRGESLTNTDPRGESLTNTDPRGESLTNTDPREESLTNTDPRGESLTNTDPQGESLTNTDPQGESLTNTDPRGESLTNTDPRGEGLTNTDPRGESLTNTDPRGESLTNSDPRGEGLTNTDLPNGSLEARKMEADLSRGEGSEVNSLVSDGCRAGPTEDHGHSDQPPFPPSPGLTIWEMKVPKLLVGRLIGKRGRYVSFLKQKSGAKIHFSPRHYNQEFQTCHMEGTKQQVHKALELIKNKFEDLDLTNVYTPPPPPRMPSLPTTSWLQLPDDVPVEVTVVKIVSAGHMFVQQLNHPSYAALSALDRDMRLCYSQPTPGLPPPTEAGVLCAAPGADGAWWRAMVTSIHKDSGEAQIRYVDYGGYRREKTGSLRQLRSDFVKLPFQGAEVVLSDVKPLPGEDGFSAEASAALEEMTRGASLLAQATGLGERGVPFIRMWKAVKEELVSVNRTLVDRGLATWLESS